MINLSLPASGRSRMPPLSVNILNRDSENRTGREKWTKKLRTISTSSKFLPFIYGFDTAGLSAIPFAWVLNWCWHRIWNRGMERTAHRYEPFGFFITWPQSTYGSKNIYPPSLPGTYIWFIVVVLCTFRVMLYYMALRKH